MCCTACIVACARVASGSVAVCPQERSATVEEHQQAAERLQARLSGQQSAGAELQEELGEQQQLLQRAQEARRAAAEVSYPLQVPPAIRCQAFQGARAAGLPRSAASVPGSGQPALPAAAGKSSQPGA